MQGVGKLAGSLMPDDSVWTQFSPRERDSVGNWAFFPAGSVDWQGTGV